MFGEPAAGRPLRERLVAAVDPLSGHVLKLSPMDNLIGMPTRELGVVNAEEITVLFPGQLSSIYV